MTDTASAADTFAAYIDQLERRVAALETSTQAPAQMLRMEHGVATPGGNFGKGQFKLTFKPTYLIVYNPGGAAYQVDNDGLTYDVVQTSTWSSAGWGDTLYVAIG